MSTDDCSGMTLPVWQQWKIQTLRSYHSLEVEFGVFHRSFPETSEVRSALWDTMPRDPLSEQVGADGRGGCGICQEVVQV